MSLLPGPFEYWDLEDGESRTIRVESYREGQAHIEPRYPGAPRKKIIPIMRLQLQPGFKPHVPNYWDISSKHLQVALRPYLNRQDLKDLEFVITKFGVPPRARYSLEVR